MQRWSKELTKEQWDNCTYVDDRGRRHIKGSKEGEIFNESVIMGYGLYGTDCYEKDGKYMCYYDVGNSCD